MTQIQAQNVHDLKPSKRLGKGGIYDLAWSPRQQLFVIGTSLGLYFYHHLDQPFDDFLETAPGGSRLLFHPNGNDIIVGYGNGRVERWDLPTKTLKRSFSNNYLWNMAISPDGKLLVIGGSDETAEVWNMEEGTHRFSLPVIRGRQDTDIVAAFSSDGHILATGGTFDHYSTQPDETIRLWDLQSGAEIAVLRGHGGSISGLSFSSDGQYMVSSSHDSSIIIWDVENWQQKFHLQAHTTNIFSLALNPSGELLASGYADKKIRLWNLKTGLLLDCFIGHSNTIDRLEFLSEDLLASIEGNSEVWIRNAKTGSIVYKLGNYCSSVTSMSFGSDNSTLITGHYDGTIRVWFSKEDAPPIFINGHRPLPEEKGTGFQIDDLAVNTNRIIFASHNILGEVRLWDMSTQRLTHILPSSSEVNCFTFTSEGSKLIMGGRDGLITLYNLLSYHEYVINNGQQWCIFSITVHNELLASSGLLTGGENSIALWDLNTSTELYHLRGQAGKLVQVCFSPNGQLLVSVSDDSTIYVWELNTRTLKIIIHAELNYWHKKVTFSPNGQLLVASTLGHITVWDAGLGTVLAEIPTTIPFSSLAFSPNGDLLAGGGNGVIQFWEIGG